jgi:ribosomal protein L17
MKKKYKNELFNFINSTSLGVESFDIIETSEDDFLITKILYKNTPLIFTIRNSPESFDSFDYKFVKFSPTYNETSFYPENSWLSFLDVFESFKEWVNNHVMEFLDEIHVPDLWTEYNKGNRTLNFKEIDFDNHDSFNFDEKKQIAMAINELKLLIHKQIGTTQKEQKLVDQRLDYLIETSKRLNKFDWKSVAVSTLMSISIALTLDSGKGKLLFDLFKEVFSVIPMLVK